MRTRGVGGLARTFVGRDAELARLEAAYRRSVERSRPVLVTVLGDAGLGKTRLMRELWERLADDEPSPLRRIGRCLAYGEGITYWPLAEVLKEHFSILESDPPEEARRRLDAREILGTRSGNDSDATVLNMVRRESSSCLRGAEWNRKVLPRTVECSWDDMKERAARCGCELLQRRRCWLE